MKRKLVYFLGTLMLLSFSTCASLKKTKKVKDPYFTLKIEEELSTSFVHNGAIYPPVDKKVYDAIIKRGDGEKCAQLRSYNWTSMELVSLTQNYTQFKTYEYQSCQAIKYADTIEVKFYPWLAAGGDLSYFASKTLQIRLVNGKFDSSLTHTSDALPAIRKQPDGTWKKGEFPKSLVDFSRVNLARDSFAVGDTIKGKFYCRSAKLATKYKPEEKELIKGSFRVILEDRDSKCR